MEWLFEMKYKFYSSEAKLSEEESSSFALSSPKIFSLMGPLLPNSSKIKIFVWILII
jgi:hypothetical protein